MFELRVPIPVVTPQGDGVAVFIETDHIDQRWTVVMVATGAVITFPQSKIRVMRNYSLGIAADDAWLRNVLKQVDLVPK